MKERRKHFLINKPLQLRYMSYITLTLVTISLVALAGLYLGIWGSILDSFSEASVRNDLLTAARLTQYEAARYPTQDEAFSSLSFFKQTEKLSQRQREIFKSILDESNKKLLLKLLLLFFFIAWGSIFLSHRIAGPLYRFHVTLEELQKGNLTTRIRLRKGDEGKFIAEDFNRALTILEDHIVRLKNLVRNQEKKPNEIVPEIREELGTLKTRVDS